MQALWYDERCFFGSCLVQIILYMHTFNLSTEVSLIGALQVYIAQWNVVNIKTALQVIGDITNGTGLRASAVLNAPHDPDIHVVLLRISDKVAQMVEQNVVLRTKTDSCTLHTILEYASAPYLASLLQGYCTGQGLTSTFIAWQALT
ncbi:hypothetical protein ACJX0J_031865, partial [Zea mays]